MIDPTTPDFTNSPVSSNRPGFEYVLADPTTPPYVSIITPFYNTGPVFHETARSVLQQSFQQWEWLIVNDGSTDPDALALLADYRHKDPRIRVIDHPENRGLSAARNTGFHKARTEYVVQLDSDDLLEPTAVEKWLWFLESYPEYAFCKGYSVGFGAQEYLWQGGFHEREAFLSENRVDCTSMVRKSAHRAAGGFDEANRHGFEDWEFWLRCATAGYWGGTVPEYLNWYRRRPAHSDRWSHWDDGAAQATFLDRLHQRYAHLWLGGFPQLSDPSLSVSRTQPCDNRLQKHARRLLMVAPWLSLGGADESDLGLLRQLSASGWEITIATTLPADHSSLSRFAALTPDLFALPDFLRLGDYPRFLRYLIHSRQIDTVLVSHSELGYLLLPYLRAHFPGVSVVDFCRVDRVEEEGEHSRYLRMAIEYQALLDLNIVCSQHLKSWMIQHGADPDRVAVCETGVDPNGRSALSDANKPLATLLAEAAVVREAEPRPGNFVAGHACAFSTVEYLRLAQESERKIREQESAIAELKRANARLDEERAGLQRLAEERHAWIGELERAKTWLEEQRGNWQRIAGERESVINSLQQSFWVRFGSRLRRLTAPASSRPASGTQRSQVIS